ncbi:hypothetical protein [Endozoicomonas sp. ONNA2]|uniref:hypothetical protein n=1 Tax=Endozoicomonas sp. ONNA2 TaxID=2828741 RepID=UPI002147D8D0|nr:hypothetical protein [Endozoicomonas sp. ONNA2]
MSNPISNSAPQFPVRTSPGLQELSQPGGARANTHADSSIPQHFSGRAVKIAGQQPPLFASQQGEVEVALANRRVNVPGIYLPTGPTDSPGPKGLIGELKPPRLTHSPGAAFTPESGGGDWSFP